MLVSCGSSTPSAAAEAARVNGPVDVGNGRTIHLECSGSGSPAVILVLVDPASEYLEPTLGEGSWQQVGR
ncbi:hypothetical protein [Mycolicibacterium lacusdiani]|uniref:hypothetical protein n=1 Tax=Mycolicibacterium lacusdiani TaxID=2895283 RepID=UPI001F29258E|nr:hypothetical protein [Mycolicibacterium lacusdiani]